MVVIKQYSNTQITSLNALTGRVLYDSTLNVLRFNDSASYNNILKSKFKGHTTEHIRLNSS